MKAVKARIGKFLPKDARIEACDNSGAQILRIISIKGSKTSRGRHPTGGVADFIMASVVKGDATMRKQVVPAIIVRQKKEYRRKDGMRIKFQDNAAVVLKDKDGNPKGTVIKGPIAKEVADRWPQIAKIAKTII